MAAELGISRTCGSSNAATPIQGSFKDLGMTVLVSMVKELLSSREVHPGCGLRFDRGYLCGAIAAYAAAAANSRRLSFCRKGKVSVAQLIQPVANGCHCLCPGYTDFDGCMEIVRKVAENDGVYLANSMNSLRIEGQKTVGIEIVRQFDWEVPDWLIIPGGNLGNVSALAKGLDMMFELGLIRRKPRICVAQAEAANPLYLSYQRDFRVFEPIAARPTVASAIQIGNPVSAPKAIDALKRYDGVVEQASEVEIAEACAEADRTGLFNCPHTGVALVALNKLIANGTIRKSDRVVVISTAHGLKFADFKIRYHESRLVDVEPQLSNPPIELPADYDQVRDRMLREIDVRATEG